MTWVLKRWIRQWSYVLLDLFQLLGEKYEGYSQTDLSF